MSSIHLINNKKILIVKGAPDVLFKKCKAFDVKKAKGIYNK